MKKNTCLFGLLYYVLVPCVYLGIIKLAGLFLRLWKHNTPADALLVALILLFFFLPVLTGVMMRFSLLKWCVDPFAAAELPLVLYGVLFHSEFTRTNGFLAAAQLTNAVLWNNLSAGWLLLMGMFLFGLAFSFSFARTRGESAAYRLLAKIVK